MLPVLLSAALARLGRQPEALAACDAGLRLPRPLAGGGGGGGGGGDPRVAAGAHSSLEHERLLLRRAGCFLALGQPAHAVADYRSAAALNPKGAQAAAGVRSAWRALEASRPAAEASLYAILDAPTGASADALRKAYHRAALRWHPDKHARDDSAQQAEAAERFKQVQAAWAVLSDVELRVAYDEELEKQPSESE